MSIIKEQNSYTCYVGRFYILYCFGNPMNNFNYNAQQKHCLKAVKAAWCQTQQYKLISHQYNLFQNAFPDITAENLAPRKNM